MFIHQFGPISEIFRIPEFFGRIRLFQGGGSYDLRNSTLIPA